VRSLCLALPGLCLCQRRQGCLLLGVPRLVFGADLLIVGLELSGQRCQPDAFFLALKALRVRVQLDEYVTRLDLLNDYQACRHDPARHGGGNRMHRLIHFETRRLGDGVDSNASQQAPATQPPRRRLIATTPSSRRRELSTARERSVWENAVAIGEILTQ
jgi:hypothetical protein